ncbi:hypothetical protein BKA70DRAFT_1568054 [Coprinopsis sp. MPI-PUGE-AT-0042]|nr:hypothetical protein BKA70DRAFT_1568054 [Coprinopsis sp. MPI-PUGE-AT-0042]
MVYWSNTVAEYAVSFHSGNRFIVMQDLVSLPIYACFFVIQGQILWRLYHQLRRKKNSDQRPRSNLIFGFVSMILGAGYMICTIFLVTSLLLKLPFVAKLVKTTETAPACPIGYSKLLYHGYLELCMEDNKVYLQRVMSALDATSTSLFQLMIIFADALLVYRCFIVFEAPWAWIISVLSGLSLLGSFALISLPEKRLGPGGVIFIVAGTYTSLLANLIVSPALILRVWLARREMESLGSGWTQAHTSGHSGITHANFAYCVQDEYNGYVDPDHQPGRTGNIASTLDMRKVAMYS